jgi:hypothetical protein
MAVTDSALAAKLLIRPHQRVTLLNPPDGFTDRLAPLPDEATIEIEPMEASDVVVVFVENRAILQRDANAALSFSRRDGVLWLAFPKGTSRLKTDLSRDAGWEVMTTAGYVGVSLVSIDETWSAFRFRPVDLVGSKRSK